MEHAVSSYIGQKKKGNGRRGGGAEQWSHAVVDAIAIGRPARRPCNPVPSGRGRLGSRADAARARAPRHAGIANPSGPPWLETSN
jgi:hypothetical protein